MSPSDDNCSIMQFLSKALYAFVNFTRNHGRNCGNFTAALGNSVAMNYIELQSLQSKRPLASTSLGGIARCIRPNRCHVAMKERKAPNNKDLSKIDRREFMNMLKGLEGFQLTKVKIAVKHRTWQLLDVSNAHLA